MKKQILILLLLCFVLGGCSSAAPLPENLPPESERLVIYTSHKEDVYRPIIREFEARTGIWVQVVTGGTSDLLARIEKEQASPRADVMFGGGVESLEAARDWFDPYRCSGWDSTAAAFHARDDAWTPFSALPIVLIYNTKLVDPDMLTGWHDLLRPEFTGRIAFADPGRSGSSFTAMVTCLAAGVSMQELTDALAGSQLDSSGEVLSMVADGSCLVGITLEETALQRIAAGDNIAMVYPEDGTSCVPDGTAVVLGAPHGDNARLFVDFTQSREVQQLLGSRFFRRSVLKGVLSDDTLTSLSDLNVLDYDAQWAAAHREELLTQWSKYREEGSK